VHRGVWFLQGYEADAAEVARPLIQPHEVVVASFPEPYRLIIGNDTQSVADRPPFLFMNSSASTTALVIIEDEGMRTVFPEFSATLQNAFAQYKVHSIPLTSPFRYGGAITTPTEPLHLYRLTLAEFKNSVPDPF
jgi:hypothetical protein